MQPCKEEGPLETVTVLLLYSLMDQRVLLNVSLLAERVKIVVPDIFTGLVIHRIVRIHQSILRETPVRTILTIGHRVSETIGNQ